VHVDASHTILMQSSLVCVGMDSASPDAVCIAGEQSTISGAFNTAAFTFSLAEKPVVAELDGRGSRHSHRSPHGHGPQR
jgi:hypothetical protein